MPQRLLRSGITTSRRFNALDWPAQSFFVRLITIVDDYGRSEADHSLLASLCFPMYRADKCPRIADICQQLSAQGMVIFYQIDGTDYLQLTRWKERVRSESKHPAPPADKCPQMTADCGQMIASTPQPTPQPTPGGAVVLLNALAELYSRKAGQPFTYAEQHDAVAVVKRTGWEQELSAIRAWITATKTEDRKYLPQSMSRLLGEWQANVDRSNSNKPAPVKRFGTKGFA